MKIIESDFMYKGYRCVTTFMDNGYRCGYVGLEKTHPLYGKDMSDAIKVKFADIFDQSFGKRSPILMLKFMAIEPDEPISLDFYFDVHGGITYADGNGNHPVESDLWWLGFDCGHAGDARDIETLKILWPDTERTQYLMNDLTFEDDVVRTKEYVQEECKSLVDQIIEYCEKYEKE
jgi:hypothetical protein